MSYNILSNDPSLAVGDSVRHDGCPRVLANAKWLTKVDPQLAPLYAAQIPEAFKEMPRWIGEGRLKAREDVVDRIETFPEAILTLFNGENFGKLVIKVSHNGGQRSDVRRDVVSDWSRPVVAFEIRGKDSRRLQDFYRELFNWKIDVNEALGVGRSEPGIGPPAEGIGGVFLQGDTPGVSIYIQVANLRESLDRAERLGGKKVLDPVDVPGGPTIARIQDPEGNVIGLVQQ